MELLNEALNCFWFGCSKASIIMSGEALQRALTSYVLQNVNEDTEIVTYRRGKTTTKSLKKDVLFDENDNGYSFQEIIQFFLLNRKENIDLKNKIYTVKNLRNKVVHSEFPVLHEHDPDEPRDNKELLDLLKGKSQIREAYQFDLKISRKTHKTVFIPENYNIKTLKSVSSSDRLALIQFFLVLDVVKDIG